MVIDSVFISLKITSMAVIISFFIGIGLARIFTKYEIRGSRILEAFIILPLFLPPSVVGYMLLIFIGKKGILGSILYKYFNISLIFSWKAAVLAAFVVSIPIMYQSAKGAFLNVNPIYLEAARVMGANEWQIFWKITVPLSIKGILSGLILSFGRAFGEFGATLMVAGNIPGKTQTIPMAIYYAVENGDKFTANTLMFIVISISFTIIFILNYVLKSKNTY
ncbi:molybdate ABC transporter permease subunit [Haloimpatiens sp. FM7330]|uniref:molybdate ABC transporter permease subunit n=1 Tax=Haloimpatiens sp. FM7330 TaxID=3298610 RepID=UPI0036448436